MISANGELQASKALANAAKTVVDCPHALQVSSTILRHLYNQILDSLTFQLRFLQVLNNISEDSDVITFPLPLKTISWLTQKRRMKHKRNI